VPNIGKYKIKTQQKPQTNIKAKARESIKKHHM
jgi:hypothetical protein